MERGKSEDDIVNDLVDGGKNYKRRLSTAHDLFRNMSKALQDTEDTVNVFTENQFSASMELL